MRSTNLERASRKIFACGCSDLVWNVGAPQSRTFLQRHGRGRRLMEDTEDVGHAGARSNAFVTTTCFARLWASYL
jgi:hypothetical protein